MRTEITPRQLEIIEAAGQLITEDGYAKLTTKRLAERMQFSEAALYRHFASKEAILVSMLEHLTASVQLRMTEVAAREVLPEPRLRAMFDSHFSYFKAHPQYLMAIFATNFMEPSPATEAANLGLMEVMRQHLRTVIVEGQKTGSFTKTLSADMLVHIVMGTFRLHMLQWRISGRGFDLTRKGRGLMDAVISLISTK